MADNPIVRTLAGMLILMLFWPPGGQAADADPAWQFYGHLELNSFIRDPDQRDGSRTLDLGFEKIKLGAKYRADRIKARFEYGIDGELRRLWGEWRWGQARFLVGQDYTPVYMDYCLEDYGGLSAGRRAMLQLQIRGLKIAAIEPRQKKLGVKGASRAVLPKMEVSWEFRNDPFGLALAGGLNRYSIRPATGDLDILSWVLGLGIDMKWGPLFLGGSIHMGQNPGPYGLSSVTDGNPVIAGSDVHDNQTLGYAVLVRYLFGDDVMVETGWGQRRNRADQALGRDRARSVYVLCQYAPVQGLKIRPEIGVQDYEAGLAGRPASRTLYYGIKWEVDF